MTKEAKIRELALQFIDEAFATLCEQHVIPTPVFHPFATVGRDFFGPYVSGAAFTDLEKELSEAFPERFAAPLKSDLPEFPSTYLFTLLEAAIARCGSERDLSIDSDGVGRSVDELLELLRPGDDEVICARAVSHLSTVDGEPLMIGELVDPPENTFRQVGRVSTAGDEYHDSGPEDRNRSERGRARRVGAPRSLGDPPLPRGPARADDSLLRGR